jgi:hypothetical protein
MIACQGVMRFFVVAAGVFYCCFGIGIVWAPVAGCQELAGVFGYMFGVSVVRVQIPYCQRGVEA